MVVHFWAGVTIYVTYTKGVMIVSSMIDNDALYGTDDVDNPFADLEKIEREIRTLLLKISLTSTFEDIPQFAFNVLHYNIKNSEESTVLSANATSFFAGEEAGGGEEGSHELLYLLKSTFMVSDQSLFCGGKNLALSRLPCDTDSKHVAPLTFSAGLHRHDASACVRESVAKEETKEDYQADEDAQCEPRFLCAPLSPQPPGGSG